MKNEHVPDGEKPLLLIVEDEDVLLELLRGMLESHGFRVLTARDGVEAIELYKTRSHEIRLVLTDMGLPRMGGWEVLSEVRSINPDAMVICASGFLEGTIHDEMIAAGAAEFVQKPYMYEKLLKLIRSLISSPPST